MKEYRTKDQFEKIIESCLNGNWSQGAKECVEYGFFASDLIKAQQEAKEIEGFYFKDETDIALVAEMAQGLR